MGSSGVGTAGTVVLIGLAIGGAVSGASGATAGSFDPVGGADAGHLAGSGTPDDPYEITTAAGLQAISEDPDGYYVLTGDVDANATRAWNEGRGFDPIEGFTGTLDGRNHTVSGLTVDRPGADRAGLFAGTSGSVRNLRLTDVSIRGARQTGGLAGHANGSLERVSVTGAVTGTDSVGGLVGTVGTEGAVSRSSAVATVDGDTDVGGLVGTAAGSVSASAAAGRVTGASNVGGLVGRQVENTVVRDTYATGPVDGGDDVGGLVGYLAAGFVSQSYAVGETAAGPGGDVGGVIGHNGGTVADVYWNVETSGVDAAVGESPPVAVDATGLSTAAMTGEAATTNMSGLGASGAWTPTDEYPVVRSHVDSVSLSTGGRVVVGRPSAVSASATLVDGRTVPVTETAEYASNRSFLTATDGVLEATDNGTATVTATVGTVATSRTVSVVTPPDIAVVEATVPYERAGTGVDATVRTVVENSGGAPGSIELSYGVDGSVVGTRTVRVEGHARETTEFTWSPPAPGEYDITVNDVDAGRLVAVEGPETTVGSASLERRTVAEGDDVRVTVRVDNAGTAAGSRTVQLTVDGAVVATERVVVPAGGTTVSLNWTADATGEFDVAVDGVAAGTVTVVEVGTVSVESIDAPTETAAGETYVLTVALENSGVVDATTTVAYSLDGERVTEKRVTVPPNGTVVSFEHAVVTAGAVEHAFTVDGNTWLATTDVVAPAATDEPVVAARGGGGTTTGADGPGFGVLVAVLALLSVVTLGRRDGGDVTTRRRR